jgi:hypothetical protein
MMQRIKTLVVAALAVLAVSAAMASSAQAQGEFTAASYPATLTGTQQEQVVLIWEDNLTKTCKQMLFHSSISAATSTLTASATYSDCTVFGFINGTIEMNGCQYRFHVTAPTGEVDTYAGTADLICPIGKKVFVKSGTCEVHVPEQLGMKEVKFISNTAAGDVTVQLNITGIKYEKVKDGFACPFTGTGTNVDGKLQGQITVAGSAGGKGVNVLVSG